MFGIVKTASPHKIINDPDIKNVSPQKFSNNTPATFPPTKDPKNQ
jgi:hypothetical protein